MQVKDIAAPVGARGSQAGGLTPGLAAALARRMDMAQQTLAGLSARVDRVAEVFDAGRTPPEGKRATEIRALRDEVDGLMARTDALIAARLADCRSAGVAAGVDDVRAASVESARSVDEVGETIGSARPEPGVSEHAAAELVPVEDPAVDLPTREIDDLDAGLDLVDAVGW